MGGGSSHPLHHPNFKPGEGFVLGHVNVYFGSETGTADAFARTLTKEGKEKGFDVRKVDLADFTPESIAASGLSVFLLANAGEGEPTTNAARFYEWIKNSKGQLANDYLEDVRYCVFGLGNSSYPNFNKVGRTTNEFLQKLGAKSVFPYSEGDDFNDLLGDFNAWREKLWAEFIPKFLPSNASAPKEPVKLQMSFQAVSVQKPSITPSNDFSRFKPEGINSMTRHFFSAHTVRVAANRELRPNNGESSTGAGAGGGGGAGGGSTRHIEFDLTSSGITSYETAENLVVLPHNSAESVELVARALGFNLDEVIDLIPYPESDFKAPFPTPCTVREALTMYYDINGPVICAVVQDMIPYVRECSQVGWINDISKRENQGAYQGLCKVGKASVVALITESVSSIKIPLTDFLNIVPFIQPRFYTISSSSAAHPTTIHTTIGVTQQLLGDGKVFRGVCSSYLAGLAVGSPCRVFLRASSFKLPQDVSIPIIMIGPGTGIAPMRALLQERALQRSSSSSSSSSSSFGTNTLYFGCRRRDEDYIYADELTAYEQAGVLDRLLLAFSREGAEKVYVQTLMRVAENAAAIVRDLEQGAYVYVCGATAMGADVHEALVDIWAASSGKTKDLIVQDIKALQHSGRYVQELWSAS